MTCDCGCDGDEGYWFTDTVDVDVTPLTKSGIELTGHSAKDGSVVEIDDDPWIDFFGTDQFRTFKATVARPIEQTYHFGDEKLVLKKPERELKEACWQLDNCPWTVTHPDERRVTEVEQIRGFWRNPQYEDGLQATLHVPANDRDALNFIDDSKAVSVGFQADVEWADDHEDIDGRQENLILDHVSSVNHGRCPVDEGCGIHTDSSSGRMEAPSPSITDSEPVDEPLERFDDEIERQKEMTENIEVTDDTLAMALNDRLDRLEKIENRIDELETQLSAVIDGGHVADDDGSGGAGRFDLRDHTNSD